MKITEPLQSVAREAELFNLTNDQIEALETWYRELHCIIDGDSLRTVINNNHAWNLTLGEWIATEQDIAAEVAARSQTPDEINDALRIARPIKLNIV